MLIKHIELIPYLLPLHYPRPRATSPAGSLHKKGYLLKLTLADREIISDVPHLPGFTPGPVGAIPSAFVSVKRLFSGTDFFELNKRTSELSHPSLAFGFDSLSLLSPTSPLTTGTSITIKKNVLMDLPSEEVAPSMAAGLSENSPSVKIKVGRGNVSREAGRVKAVISSLRRPVRLDANGAWNEEECQQFLEGLGREKQWIEYLEEPLGDSYGLADLDRLFEHSGIPYALDERFRILHRQHKVPAIESYLKKGLKAIVIKPSLGPGLSHCRQYIKQYKNEVKWVVSSAFETDLGLLALGYFIKELGLDQQAGGHGLDTYRWIQKPLLKLPILDSYEALTLPYQSISTADLAAGEEEPRNTGKENETTNGHE